MNVMKVVFMIVGLGGTAAQANIGDIEQDIEFVKMDAVALAQPAYVLEKLIVAAESCTLPTTHLVEVPHAFEAAGEVVVACASH